MCAIDTTRWDRLIVLGLTATLLPAALVAAQGGPQDKSPQRDDHQAAEPGEPIPPGMDTPAQRLGPQGWGDRPFFEPRPEKDYQRIREFIEEHFPEWAGELRRMESLNPRLFRARVREIAPRIFRLMHELDEDEELGMLSIEEERLEIQIRRAVRTYFDSAEETRREQIRAELAQMIRRQFEIRQRRGERTVGKLEARLERMRRRLERRARNAEELITSELQELLRGPVPRGPRRGEAGPRRPGGPRPDRFPP